MVLFHKRQSDVEEICGNVKEKYMKKKDEELFVFCDQSYTPKYWSLHHPLIAG